MISTVGRSLTVLLLLGILSQGNTCGNIKQCRNLLGGNPSSMSDDDFYQSPCMCDEDCPIYGDCCEDAAVISFPQSSGKEFSCVPVIKGYPQQSFYIKFRCHSEWKRDNIKQLCEADNENIFNNLYITNVKLKLTYKNIYCAVCNWDAVADLLPWEFHLLYGFNFKNNPILYPSQFFPFIYEQLKDENCDLNKLLPIVRKAVRVINFPTPFIFGKLRRCRALVKDCASGNEDEDVENDCHRTNSFYFSTKSQRWYKNMFCAKCNSEGVICLNGEIKEVENIKDQTPGVDSNFNSAHHTLNNAINSNASPSQQNFGNKPESTVINNIRASESHESEHNHVLLYGDRDGYLSPSASLNMKNINSKEHFVNPSYKRLNLGTGYVGFNDNSGKQTDSLFNILAPNSDNLNKNTNSGQIDVNPLQLIHNNSDQNRTYTSISTEKMIEKNENKTMFKKKENGESNLKKDSVQKSKTNNQNGINEDKDADVEDADSGEEESSNEDGNENEEMKNNEGDKNSNDKSKDEDENNNADGDEDENNSEQVEDKQNQTETADSENLNDKDKSEDKENNTELDNNSDLDTNQEDENKSDKNLSNGGKVNKSEEDNKKKIKKKKTKNISESKKIKQAKTENKNDLDDSQNNEEESNSDEEENNESKNDEGENKIDEEENKNNENERKNGEDEIENAEEKNNDEVNKSENESKKKNKTSGKEKNIDSYNNSQEKHKDKHKQNKNEDSSNNENEEESMEDELTNEVENIDSRSPRGSPTNDAEEHRNKKTTKAKTAQSKISNNTLSSNKTANKEEYISKKINKKVKKIAAEQTLPTESENRRKRKPLTNSQKDALTPTVSTTTGQEGAEFSDTIEWLPDIENVKRNNSSLLREDGDNNTMNLIMNNLSHDVRNPKRNNGGTHSNNNNGNNSAVTNLPNDIENARRSEAIATHNRSDTANNIGDILPHDLKNVKTNNNGVSSVNDNNVIWDLTSMSTDQNDSQPLTTSTVNSIQIKMEEKQKLIRGDEIIQHHTAHHDNTKYNKSISSENYTENFVARNSAEKIRETLKDSILGRIDIDHLTAINTTNHKSKEDGGGNRNATVHTRSSNEGNTELNSKIKTKDILQTKISYWINDVDYKNNISEVFNNSSGPSKDVFGFVQDVNKGFNAGNSSSTGVTSAHQLLSKIHPILQKINSEEQSSDKMTTPGISDNDSNYTLEWASSEESQQIPSSVLHFDDQGFLVLNITEGSVHDANPDIRELR